MNKNYIIVNTNASVGSGLDKWNRIKLILEDYNISYDYDFTESKNHAALLAQNAIRNSYSTIIVAGGDGTANEVINGLINSKPEIAKTINIGIIPIGTGNDWCRSLEIPSNIEKAIEIIQAGRTIKHDVGLVTYSKNERRKKRYFINIAGLGFDSIVLKKTNELKEKRTLDALIAGKKRKGGSMYIQALMSSLITFKAIDLKITIEKHKVFSKKAFSMAIGIGRFNGNGMEQLPSALLNDGLFDINIIHAVSKFRIIKNLSALYNGTIHTKKIVSMYRAKTLKIDTEDFALVETDGELLGEAPFEFSILPLEINVLSLLKQ